MTTQLTGPVMVVAQDIFSESVNPLHRVGSYVETADGRGFRYAKVGAVATVAGKVYQGTALDATNLQVSGGSAVAAQAIGDTQLTLTGSLTLAANLLAGSYASVDVTPGQGYIYRVAGNTAVAGAANCVVTLEDSIQIALTTASRVIFAANTYANIVIEPGTPTAAIAGVATRVTTAASHMWLQTRGACSVLFTGTGVAGKAVGSLSGGTSGSVAPAIAATNIIGYHMATGISTEYALIHLTLG